MPRRIFGVDQGGISRQLLSQAGDTIAQTNQSLSNSVSQQSKLSAQITQDAIDSNQAITSSIVAQSQARIAQSQARQNNLNQFVKGIAAIGDSVARTMEAELQKKVEEQQRQQDIENLQAFVDVQQLTSNAEQRIYESSPDEFEAQVHKVIAKYPNLSNKDRIRLFGTGYEALSRVEKQRYQRITDGIDKINQSVTSQKKQQISLVTGGILSRLENSFGSAEGFIVEYDNALKNFFNDPNNANLSPLQVAQLQEFALGELSKSTRLNSSQRAAIQQKSEGATAFLRLSQQAFREFGDNPELYQTRLYQIANETGFPYDVALKVTDPNQSRKQLIEHIKLQNELRDLQSNSLMRDFNNQRFNDKFVGMTALLLMNDPQFEASVDANPTTKQNVLIQTAKRIREQLVDYQDLSLKNGRDIQSLQTQLATWNTKTTEFVQSNGASQNPINLLSQFIKLNSQTVPGLADKLEGLAEGAPTVDPTDPSFTPEQRQEALRQWAEWRKLGADAINNQIILKQKELQQAADKLERYEILDADFNDPSTLERMRQEYDSLVGEIRAISQQAPKGGILRGSRSNFNSGDSGINTAFATAESSLGHQILLPLRPGTNARISDGYGEAGSPRHGRSRNHGGLDVAVAAGTPIISPVQGEVVNFNNDPDNPTGYGIFVDVKDMATGRVHRFAHLQSASVRKGDILSRGQDFAKVGNTGRSSGAHLHWEIRTEVGGRFENTLDVENLAAELLRPSSVTHPRGDNLDWYSNAPNPYMGELEQRSTFNDMAIPGRAVPLVGMSSIMEGLIYSNGTPVGDVTSTFNTANVMRNSFVRYDKQGFDPQKHNQGHFNYGYAKLARQPKATQKIADVATRLGIPAVWLADVIAFESGFNPSIDNGYDPDGDGFGYVGLIQFGKAAAERVGTTPSELKSMDFNTQMEYVYRYLSLPEFRGQLKTIQHVLAAVFGGRGLINKLNKNPKSAYSTGDINISFGDYLKRLGRDAGRQYSIPGLNSRRSRVASAIHETYQGGCTVCNSLRASNSPVIPHEGQN